MSVNQKYFLDYKHAKLQIFTQKKNCFKLNSLKHRKELALKQRQTKNKIEQK